MVRGAWMVGLILGLLLFPHGSVHAARLSKGSVTRTASGDVAVTELPTIRFVAPSSSVVLALYGVDRCSECGRDGDIPPDELRSATIGIVGVHPEEPPADISAAYDYPMHTQLLSAEVSRRKSAIQIPGWIELDRELQSFAYTIVAKDLVPGTEYWLIVDGRTEGLGFATTTLEYVLWDGDEVLEPRLRSWPDASLADSGLTSIVSTVADWDADGWDDPAYAGWDGSTWTWLVDTNGIVDSFPWTSMPSTARPVIGDFDADQIPDRVWFDTSNGQWGILQSSDGTAPAGWPDGSSLPVSPGLDLVPVIGDWDGDGADDLGLYSRVQETWWLYDGASAVPNPAYPDPVPQSSDPFGFDSVLVLDDDLGRDVPAVVDTLGRFHRLGEPGSQSIRSSDFYGTGDLDTDGRRDAIGVSHDGTTDWVQWSKGSADGASWIDDETWYTASDVADVVVGTFDADSQADIGVLTDDGRFYLLPSKVTTDFDDPQFVSVQAVARDDSVVVTSRLVPGSPLAQLETLIAPSGIPPGDSYVVPDGVNPKGLGTIGEEAEVEIAVPPSEFTGNTAVDLYLRMSAASLQTATSDMVSLMTAAERPRFASVVDRPGEVELEVDLGDNAPGTEVQIVDLTDGSILAGPGGSSWWSPTHGSVVVASARAPGVDACFGLRARNAGLVQTPLADETCARAPAMTYWSLDPTSEGSSPSFTYHPAFTNVAGEPSIELFFGDFVQELGSGISRVVEPSANGGVRDVTPTGAPFEAQRVSFGDWNSDWRRDWFIASAGYQGPRVLVETTSDTLVEVDGAWPAELADWSSSLNGWADFDGDGTLDFLATKGDSLCVVTRDPAGVGSVLLRSKYDIGSGSIRSIDIADHDGDGDPDLLVGQEFGAIVLENAFSDNFGFFQASLWAYSDLPFYDPRSNIHDEFYAFEPVAKWAHLWSDERPAVVLAWENAVEIFANEPGRYVFLPELTIGDVARSLPSGAPAGTPTDLVVADMDNDGRRDIVVNRSDGGVAVYFAYDDGKYRFTNACDGSELCEELASSEMAVGDFDRDGWLDVFRQMGGASGRIADPFVDRHWLQLDLRGDPATGNALGIGATVELVANGRVQRRQHWITASNGVQSTPFLHFGLGEAETVERLEVIWPGGESQSLMFDVPVDRIMTVFQENTAVGVDPEPSDGTKGVSISSIRPSPFRAFTTITFSLDRTRTMEATIHDARGRRVRSLVSGSLSAGRHTIEWVGRDDGGALVASGVYYLRVDTGEHMEVRRLVRFR